MGGVVEVGVPTAAFEAEVAEAWPARVDLPETILADS